VSYVTRFAPSPTGPLHLGHAYSALLAHDRARAQGGKFLLRIEDIDTQRSKREWEAQIYRDLEWLGVTWDESVVRQSERSQAYQQALDTLWHSQNLLYPCYCTRRDIKIALSAMQEGVITGPDGPIYPGTCREITARSGPYPNDLAMRLDMQSALGDHQYCFNESGSPTQHQETRICNSASDIYHGVGDIVLSRKDFLGSYHLSVVLDDAAQGITEVIRGEDLFDATKIHVVLQRILGLPTPNYHHHRLIRDENGKRLAKRDDARAISKYREDGATPNDIRRLVGL